MDTSRSLRRLLVLAFVLACGCGGQTPAPEDSKVSLAVEGFDVVAYFGLPEKAAPVPGKPKFEYVWDEQRWRFASAANMARFKEDPAHYAPRFGNNCTGALAYGLAGPNFPAKPEIWAVVEDRLYLFGSPQSRIDFDKDHEPVISGAQRNMERLARGEKPRPEVRLPPEGILFLQGVIADAKFILDNQPPAEAAGSSGQETARP